MKDKVLQQPDELMKRTMNGETHILDKIGEMVPDEPLNDAMYKALGDTIAAVSAVRAVAV